MFDVGASELLMIVIVAVVVIGPKDMPMALRTAGRWIGKMRKMSNHFRAGLDAMVREAELEEMERKWREQNEAIMNASPQLIGAEQMLPPAAALPPLPSDVQNGAAADDEQSDQGQSDMGQSDLGRPETAPRQSELHLPPPPP